MIENIGKRSPLFQALRDSLGLLPRRERRKYWIAVLGQIATNIFDLLGVILIGLTGLLAALAIQGEPAPTYLSNIAQRLGITVPSAAALAATTAVLAATFLVFKNLAYAIVLTRTYRFLAKSEYDVSCRLFHETITSPSGVIESQTTQELSFSLTEGIKSATLLLLGALSIILSEVFLLLFMGIALLLISPSVTLVAGIYFAVVSFFLHKSLEKWSHRIGHEVRNNQVRTTTVIQETLRSRREVFTSQGHERILQKIRAPMYSLSRAYADEQVIQQLPKMVYETALVIGAVGLCAWQLSTSNLTQTLGILALFLAAGARLLPSLMRLNGKMIQARSLAALSAPAHELAESLRFRPDEERDSTISNESNLLVDSWLKPPSLEMVEVSYTYPGAIDPTIESASLNVKAGLSVAIVGESGAGKSTLVDLLLGVLAPSQGSIKINSIEPRKAIEMGLVRVAYLPQNVALFNGSLRENLIMGPIDLEPADDEIWEVLERVRLTDVLTFPRKSLDRQIGESGIKLSGGQRQRLGLARALLRRPTLLALDEATSALDSVTESEISQTLEELHGTITRITVAHRLSTVRQADEVILVESGTITARGTFDELLTSSASFRRQAANFGGSK